MSAQPKPWLAPVAVAELDRDARLLVESLSQDLSNLALERISGFCQPLVDSLRFSRVMLEAVTDGALAFDQTGRVLLANTAVQRLFSLSPDVEGSMLEELPELTAIAEQVRHALTTATSSASQRVTLERGSERWELDVALHFCRDARNGQAYWLLAIVRDLTALKDLTFQLSQSSKLASLGTMLACIVHDVNNPLANILGYSELIAQDMEENPQPGTEKLQSRIRIILEETLRARRIVENCLSFARHSRGQHRPVQVAQLIEDTLDIFRSHLKSKGAKIEMVCEPDLPTIYGNRGLLQQVIFNLVKNAIDVLGQGGVVWVRARAQENDMVIEVADNGPGIKPEHRSKLFSPFFTTKNEKEGTGLGLSISKTIVEEHGGALTFDTALGTGTTFTVTLPIERRSGRRAAGAAPPAPAAPVQAAPVPAPEPGAQPRVLVVGDDPVMGGLIADLVQRWYAAQCEVVFSIESARASLSTGKFKLAFLDVRMNGIDPVGALDTLKEVAGPTPVVTMSGAERPEFVEALLRRGSAVHLRKPFSLNTLLKVLGRMLPGQMQA